MLTIFLQEDIQMAEWPELPEMNYRDPETKDDIHRPIGFPRPRETQSQKAQLNSGHRHGTDKSLKVKMSKKTGLD
jgi:hypothetical protein